VLERSTDAFFGERAILLDAAQRGPAAGDLRVLDHHFTHERLALALPRNDDDFRLLIDRTLSRLYRAPGFAALYADWFGPLDADAQRFFQWSALPD
jgi:putrescine:ornithine antiporter